MKARNKKVLAGILSAAMVLSVASTQAFALGYTHGSDVTSTDTSWSDWQQEWQTVATDYTKVSMTPGADETQLNFAWYSEGSVDDATPAVRISILLLF